MDTKWNVPALTCALTVAAVLGLAVVLPADAQVTGVTIPTVGSCADSGGTCFDSANSSFTNVKNVHLDPPGSEGAGTQYYSVVSTNDKSAPNAGHPIFQTPVDASSVT